MIGTPRTFLYYRRHAIWYESIVLAQIGYPISYPPYETTPEGAGDQEIASAVRRCLSHYREGVPVRNRDELAAVPKLWAFAACRTWWQFARDAVSVAIDQRSPLVLEVSPLATIRKEPSFIQSKVPPEVLTADCSDAALAGAIRRAIATARTLDVP